MGSSVSSAGMRLDAQLAARGLARSRTRAAELVAQGRVTVDGLGATKPSQRVRDDHVLVVLGGPGYVSRAALKLLAALEEFPLEVHGRVALDVGASTGGFTQVLLERGARSVVALDVGHEQLDPALRADGRVVAVEGVNARSLTGQVLAASGVTVRPDLVVADVSFISLGLILPALVGTVGADADFVVLVKPQFEVGRGATREGIVREPALRAEAVTGVLWEAWDAGLPAAGIISSPVTGSAGNREYLVWFSTTAGSHPTEWLERVSALAGN